MSPQAYPGKQPQQAVDVKNSAVQALRFKGDKGDKGDRGLQGDKGEPGKGDKGQPGEDGKDGAPGATFTLRDGASDGTVVDVLTDVVCSLLSSAGGRSERINWGYTKTNTASSPCLDRGRSSARYCTADQPFCKTTESCSRDLWGYISCENERTCVSGN